MGEADLIARHRDHSDIRGLVTAGQWSVESPSFSLQKRGSPTVPYRGVLDGSTQFSLLQDALERYRFKNYRVSQYLGAYGCFEVFEVLGLLVDLFSLPGRRPLGFFREGGSGETSFFDNKERGSPRESWRG